MTAIVRGKINICLPSVSELNQSKLLTKLQFSFVAIGIFNRFSLQSHGYSL